jgi:hypothetical protein
VRHLDDLDVRRVGGVEPLVFEPGVERDPCAILEPLGIGSERSALERPEVDDRPDLVVADLRQPDLALLRAQAGGLEVERGVVGADVEQIEQVVIICSCLVLGS